MQLSHPLLHPKWVRHWTPITQLLPPLVNGEQHPVPPGFQGEEFLKWKLFVTDPWPGPHHGPPPPSHLILVRVPATGAKCFVAGKLLHAKSAS
jgi:hypothetical protein